MIQQYFDIVWAVGQTVVNDIIVTARQAGFYTVLVKPIKDNPLDRTTERILRFTSGGDCDMVSVLYERKDQMLSDQPISADHQNVQANVDPLFQNHRFNADTRKTVVFNHIMNPITAYAHIDFQVASRYLFF